MRPRPGTEQQPIALAATTSRPVGCEEVRGGAASQTVTATSPTRPERVTPTAGHRPTMFVERYRRGDCADRLVPDPQRVARGGSWRGGPFRTPRRAIER